MKKYHAKSLASTIARTGMGRINYPFLIKPHKPTPEARAVYSISYIFPKDDIEAKEILDEAIKDAEAKGLKKFGPGFTDVRYPIKDGDVKGDESYQNQWYIDPTNAKKVTILDENCDPLDPEDIYSGCYARCVIQFYPYYHRKDDGTINKGISASLQSIQFLADGEPLYEARHSAADDYADD